MLSRLLLCAVAGLATAKSVGASSYCGGFDLDDRGQASQCLNDDNSRNGCINAYGVRNSCWSPAPMNSCCGHGRCSGQYDRYNQHCTCDSGWSGSRCDTGTPSPPPPPPPPRRDQNANSCRYAYDGECDDGSTGGTMYCQIGTDSADCHSAPPPAPSCPSGERACLSHFGCGWCISSSWDSGCIPVLHQSSMYSSIGQNPYGNCDRGFQAWDSGGQVGLGFFNGH